MRLADRIVGSLSARPEWETQTARLAMLAELTHVQLMQTEVMRLLNFEGTYQTELALGFSLGPSRIVSAQVRPLPVENPYPTRVSLYEYDPFNYLLVNSEALNHLAAVRELHSAARSYGSSETWIVWVNEFRGLVRYQVSGELSGLHQSFPDRVSLAQMRDAGLDVSALKSPRAILKI